MKNSDVIWSKVDEKCKKCKYIATINECKIEIEYEVLKYENYYKVVVSFPFSCESNWGSTPYEWNNRAIDVIKSALNKRYKDIKLRHYKAQKLNNFFKEHNISRTKLFHTPLHEKVGDKFIGCYVKKYEAKVQKLKNLKLKDYEKENILNKNTFDKLLLNASCEYCGITIKEINKLSEEGKLYTKRARGYSMEIDQKDPNGLYSNDNCVASCYWCNNAKTDEFIVDEFKEIARGINVTWQKRLGDEKVEFPEESDIWIN